MNTAEFLGLRQLDDNLHWRLHVESHISTPGNFLFGGCGLGAAIEALEQASSRPVIWATAQFLSYATLGDDVDYEVTLAVVGGHITQGRAVAYSQGREILTVNAALGDPQGDLLETWIEMPTVPPPTTCKKRIIPTELRGTILDRVDVRVAFGRTTFDRTPGSPRTALWAQVPDVDDVTAATLSIFGDYVSGGASEPLGRRIMGRSLDNTLRMGNLVETEWVLCDIRMHAVINGYAQGVAHLWSENGTLLATASQSISVRFWPGDN